MNGTLARVFAIYPIAIPAVFLALSTAFPGYLLFDQESQRVTLTFTVPQLVGAVGGGYVLIWGIFAKWGIKR